MNSKNNRTAIGTPSNSSSSSYIPGVEIFDFNEKSFDSLPFYTNRDKFSSYIGKQPQSGYNLVTSIFTSGNDHDFGPKPDKVSLAATIKDIDDEDVRTLKNLYWKSIQDYANAKRSVYEILWLNCTTRLQGKLREDPDFEQYSTAKDLKHLWKSIEILCTRSTRTSNATQLQLLATRRFNSFHQKEEERTDDFYQRFLHEYDAYKASGCSLINFDFTPFLDASKESEFKDAIEKEEQRLLAANYLQKINKVRYSTLIDKLENDLCLGIIQYPEQLTEAYEISLEWRVEGQLVAIPNNSKGTKNDDVAFVANNNKKGTTNTNTTTTSSTMTEVNNR